MYSFLTRSLILISYSTFIKCNVEKITDKVFLDIIRENSYWGRIQIGLFGEVSPRTVSLFKQLIGNGYYEKAQFEEIIERVMVLLGVGKNDTNSNNEFIDDNQDTLISTPKEVECKELALDEPRLQHNAPGYVTTATSCKFLITTMKAPGLDGYHTIFGKVLKGQDIVHRIEHVAIDKNNYRPIKNITVARSGLLNVRSPYYESTDPYELTLWGWIKAGWFPLSFSFLIFGFFQWTIMRL